MRASVRRTAAGVVLAALALAGAAEARPRFQLGIGPTPYTLTSVAGSDVGAGISGALTVGGAFSFLVQLDHDRLGHGYHPTSALVGFRIQADTGNTPYFDLGIGGSGGGNPYYGGPASSVGLGFRSRVGRSPGWFADVHYLQQGSFEGGGSELFQFRLGLAFTSRPER